MSFFFIEKLGLHCSYEPNYLKFHPLKWKNNKFPIMMMSMRDTFFQIFCVKSIPTINAYNDLIFEVEKEE